MLTLSEHTATRVGSYDTDDDTERWRGAARKYLATVDGREYLVKPDIGWPSDRDNERVAAAFYRRLGAPVPNVVNATIGGTDACAVRILPNAYPIGDGFDNLTRSEALDVVRSAMLSTLIGDRDRHQYNWIHDGTRAYAIDHGLAFSTGTIARMSYLVNEYVYDMLDSGVITTGDIIDIANTLPTEAPRIAALAWAHVQQNYRESDIPTDIRAHFGEYAQAVASDYNGAQELRGDDWYAGWTSDAVEDEPECDCTDCIGQYDEPSDMTWYASTGEPLRWTRRRKHEPVVPVRNRMACAAMPRVVDGSIRFSAPNNHRHTWSGGRGWHSTPKMRNGQPVCVCGACVRRDGRQAGRLCPSGRVFGRKVTDITRWPA